MNEYLAEDAERDMRANVTQTYLVWYEGRLVGYFSLLADSIRLQFKERPKDVHYPSAPALKLARLAVCASQVRQGIGEALLDYVVGIGRNIAGSVGCRYITLDSHVDKVQWYMKYKFVANKGERQAQKVIRKYVQNQEEPPENLSMRYDIFKQTEIGVAEEFDEALPLGPILKEKGKKRSKKD
ncbi:MAG: GNAT family N-acetyltransferase [Gemmatimonadota bacterium]